MEVRIMGESLRLKASDGFELGAYRADPEGPAKGQIVVIQEIFGVNHYIRSVCDRLAEQGFIALAPAIFDRIQPGFESGYSEPERKQAMAFIPALDFNAALRDIEAAVGVLRNDGTPAVIGFCLGGTLSFLAATRLDGLAASVVFYGGLAKYADEKPRCPVQMHFGDQDRSIPMDDIETIKAKRPDCEIFVYPGAGHGFACNERDSYDPKATALAWERASAFLNDAFASG
ncbi:MAG TPA: dienelactone hydrolase family protein [Fimbriimonadaceae bacterium]|nr:dienelactone hydrolase family protein [Fimbriimonadaceae bacterium]